MEHFFDPLVKAQSLISLTDLGREIAKDIDAEKIFERHQVKLVEKVKEKAPINAYDIQQCSFSIVREEMIKLLSEDELVKIKKVAFDRGLLVEDIMPVFEIYLRDKILDDTGIPIPEVDNYAVADSTPRL